VATKNSIVIGILYLLSGAMLAGTAFSESSSGVEATTAKIIGSAQFWERHCSSTTECDMPTAISQEIRYEGSITKSPQEGALATWNASAARDPLTMKLAIYWKTEGTDSVAYLASQARLFHNGQPVAECSYFDQERVLYFPVGVCAGFIPESDGKGFRQWGVTFRKGPPRKVTN